ncbi:MAG: hypothetical protein DRP79_07010, partial [Planctomycetota bacterium]
IGILVSQRIERDTLEEIAQSLEAKATLLKEPAIRYFKRPPVTSFQNHIRALGKAVNTRLTVIRADGVVVADSEREPGSMDNHANRPEILAARSHGIGRAIRFSKTLQVKMMYVALPLWSEDELIGYIRTAYPLSTIDNRLRHIRTAIVFAAGLSATVALFIGFLLARHFITPLTAMTAVAESMSCGDYDQRLPTSRNDEIGKLAKAFNKMAESCREHTETIRTDRNKLAVILSGMAEGVVAVNEDERVVHLNEAAERLLSASQKESLGKPVWEITRVREVSEILSAALRDKTETQRNLQVVTQERKRFIEMHASPLCDGQGKLVGALAVLRDVSELHRLETIRSEFVANASHELKTPITAIRGLVETLIDDKELPPVKRELFLGKIKNQSLRLSSIVTDLLTLSRLESESGKLERCPVDLCEVILATAKTFVAIGEERGIAVETQVPDISAEVWGDEEALSQVVSNLLDNAIKYTPQGGRVWVRLHLQGDDAVIEVQDTGIGIEPKDRERIFERFYRVDKARSRELGGTGLGLSIVKHIVIAHGGRVTVDSTPGTGSTFRVFLSLASASM